MVSVFLSLACIDCNRRKDFNEYRTWLEDPSNDVTIIKKVGGVTLQLTYLTPEYMAYLDMRGTKNSVHENESALKRSYDSSMVFSLQIAPDTNSVRKPYTTEDIAQRLASMNYGMYDNLELITGTISEKPVLCNLESNYGINGGQRMLIVFKKPTQLFSTDKKFEIKYKDMLFETGINHFVFGQEAINNIPELKFH